MYLNVDGQVGDLSGFVAFVSCHLAENIINLLLKCGKKVYRKSLLFNSSSKIAQIQLVRSYEKQEIKFLIIPIAILSAFLIQRQNSIKIVESKPKENVQVSQNETQDPLQLPLEISVKEAHQMYQDGIFMLDVREVDEWNEGLIPGATLISLGSLERNAQAVPKDEQVVIVCRSGNRGQFGPPPGR